VHCLYTKEYTFVGHQSAVPEICDIKQQYLISSTELPATIEILIRNIRCRYNIKTGSIQLVAVVVQMILWLIAKVWLCPALISVRPRVPRCSGGQVKSSHLATVSAGLPFLGPILNSPRYVAKIRITDVISGAVCASCLSRIPKIIVSRRWHGYQTRPL